MDQEQEDILWDFWLTTDKRVSFKDFKRQRMTPIRQKKIKTSSKEDEANAIAKASRFIQPTNEKEGGDMNG